MRRGLMVLLLVAGCASAERPLPAPRAATPETPEAAWSRGRLLESSRRYGEAEAAYRRAVELGEARALWSLAYLLRAHTDRLEEAERTFVRCLEELPDETLRLWKSGRAVTLRCAVRLQLAELYIDMGRLDEAQRLLDAALEEDPDCWVALDLRGNVDLLRGDVASARRRHAAALARIGSKEAAEAAVVEYKVRWADLIDPFT